MFALYEVWDPSGDLSDAAVWAHDHGEALDLVLRDGDSNLREEHLCWRLVKPWLGKPSRFTPHREERLSVLRDIGWRADGDRECQCCYLWELNGLFPVCEGCEQCEECGCDCEDHDG